MKKKIGLYFLALLCVFSITSCGNDNIPEQDHDKQVTQENIGDKEETQEPERTQEPEETRKDTSAPDDSKQETPEADNESKRTMKILLLKNDEIIETSEISDNDKISYVYDALNALRYDVTDDTSFRDGVSVYFFDENNNMIQSFFIYENYLKLNGMPDTYKITNADFDYTVFYDELNQNILK